MATVDQPGAGLLGTDARTFDLLAIYLDGSPGTLRAPFRMG